MPDFEKLGKNDTLSSHALLITGQTHATDVEQPLNGRFRSNPIARIKLFNADNRRENYLGPVELQQRLRVLRTG
jgi:hypothetical protein